MLLNNTVADTNETPALQNNIIGQNGKNVKEKIH